jgi:NADH-quinone oxidoreductase subunit L
MRNLLWLAPTLPLAGFLILATVGARLPRRTQVGVGVGSVVLSALVSLLVAAAWWAAPGAFTQHLWTWMRVGTFAPGITFYLDALSLTMLLVVTGVGGLIHIYAAWYMTDDPGIRRFFAYMNLFVAMMVVLVLADNLPLLYLGWEGVGLCSYLLIGFWYHDSANVRAAMKAFLITRIGDTALILGIFMLYAQLGTVGIQGILADVGSLRPGMATLAAALLLGGAVGKSAQLPLQTWLPDAMAGPTPVSALIHAATMVTAGVYLIARMHGVFAAAPGVMTAVAVIGAATMLLAACSALAQRDLKRVLAYSTMSQVGLMFLALGVGAWAAAIFHFMTHAFFKALLFMGAGVVMHALGGKGDITQMGGLRRTLPLAFVFLLIGALSLAGFPFVTAGFYSKDAILVASFANPQGAPWLWAAGWLTAFLTAVYAFRMIFLVFFGAPVAAHPVRDARVTVPLGLLSVLALVGGAVPVTTFLHGALPEAHMHVAGALEGVLVLASVLASLGGIAVAYLLFGRARTAAPDAALARFWREGWGFDRLYDRLFVQPYVWLARECRHDAMDAVYHGIAEASVVLHGWLSALQTGRVRWYAAALVAGAVLLLALLVWR